MNMKIFFFAKLAKNGIKNNARLYIPYIFTGAIMVMMYYILYFLSVTPFLQQMPGGDILQTMLPFGYWIIAIFSILILFYTNLFLLRQRHKEFGLYNVLGMNKKHICFVMIWENLFISILAIISGLILGVLFSKIAELGLIKLLNNKIHYELSINGTALVQTIFLYLWIYFGIFVYSSCKVFCLSPLELLRSDKTGEKPPKANWIFAFLGILILAMAYFIAVSIEEPLTALIWFFIAVIMVIVATYLLFISGSVALCRLLQKKKNYYYKPNHFVSVSSMTYRMKRNGAGLASICILSTMILVTISSTACLYIGAEDTLLKRYPYDINLSFGFSSMDGYLNGFLTEFKQTLETILIKNTEVSYDNIQYNTFDIANTNASQNISDIANINTQQNILQQELPVSEYITYRTLEVSGYMNHGKLITDPASITNFSLDMYDNVCILQIFSLDDYNRLMGTNEILEKGECFLYTSEKKYNLDTISINDTHSFHVKKRIDTLWQEENIAIQTIPTINLVISHFDTIGQELLAQKASNNYPIAYFYWTYNLNLSGTEEQKIAVYQDIRDKYSHDWIENYSIATNRFSCRSLESETFYSTFGSLFFLGITLSFVFLFAAVLIIYYKQISEGYEDENRFAILQKVGMTKSEIRKSINSQILTVFFLPLLFAGIHLAFAFPLIWKLLQLFYLQNLKLLIGVTIVCYFIFAVFYGVIYKVTAKGYYKIVSG